MTPYYERDGITIYHGDCREILPTLPEPDLILADPPYGINYRHGHEPGERHESKWNEVPVIGDDAPFDPSWLMGIGKARILWGANHYASRLPDSRGWLVWDKRCNTGTNDQSDCEMAWTDLIKSARLFYHVWNGFLRQSERGISRVHPTQKPVALMSWCLSFAPDARLVVDPYMGSGTTLVACRRNGRMGIGIELEERYCETAARRLDAEGDTLFQVVDTEPHEQLTLSCNPVVMPAINAQAAQDQSSA